MDQLRNYGDRRNQGWCVYCGRAEETRDHVPSRILLDEPYPANPPIVPACLRCNAGYSLDEEYLACLVDCVLAGDTEPQGIFRAKIRRILSRKPKLAARIRKSKQVIDNRIIFRPEADRVRNVFLKLGHGHAAFELNEPQLDEPARVFFEAFERMTLKERHNFECVTILNARQIRSYSQRWAAEHCSGC